MKTPDGAVACRAIRFYDDTGFKGGVMRAFKAVSPFFLSVFPWFLMVSPLPGTPHPEDATIVARVNEVPIEAGFFKLQRGMKRGETIRHFTETYHASVAPAFWKHDFHGEVPLTRLNKSTLDECVRIKVQETWAKQKGIIQDLSYQGFLEDLAMENQRRKDALQNHQIIYGPQHFDAEGYFSYRFSSMLQKLKEKLSEHETANSESELRSFYEANREKFANPDLAVIHRIFIPSAPEADQRIRTIQEQFKASPSQETFDALAKRWNPDGHVLEQTFRRRSYRYHAKHFPELVERVRQLRQNQISEIFEGGGGFNLVMCVRRGEPPTFERFRIRIDQELSQRKYDQRLHALIRKAKVQINRRSLDGLELP